MRIIIAIMAACLLTACASPGPTVSPVENGGNRADGIVTMSSTTTIFNAVGPDWRMAEAGAGDRCRRWGYDGAAGRCVVCHSLEKDGPFRVAPNLWGIVGAEKARDRSWYSYSPALIEKGGDWSVDELDEYLANASQFVPGTTKSIKVQDPGERQEIIDYLNQLDD